MEEIEIKSSKHNYKVILHDNLEELLKKELDSSKNYFLIIDKVLAPKYNAILLSFLKKITIYEVEGGEKAKSFEEYERICKKLLSIDFNKNDTILSFGGGTISDLSGYVASSFKRGVNLINIPTTTLAMIDASVGGKNALNVDGIKNAVGSIYPPEKVLIGFDVLETLPGVEYANGICEGLKMGLSLDKSLFDLFLDEKLDINSVVKKSILNKKNIVEKDEFESELRKVLNFGHTIGHAIEFDSDYKIKHGFAIANGMLILSKDENYHSELLKIMKKIGAPIIKCLNVENIIEAIRNDKKSKADSVDLIVVHEIGKCEIKNISFNDLKGVLMNYGI